MQIRTFLVVVVCVLFLHGAAYAVQTAATMPSNSLSSSGMKSGPLPLPDLEGLNDYHKQLVFASRNVEEGDWDKAIENLQNAEKLRNDDPHLYEMYGIVYDSDRQSKKAFEYFKKAGEMYFNAGDIDKAWKMLGWLRTFDMDTQAVDVFEKKIRERQLAINKAAKQQ